MLEKIKRFFEDTIDDLGYSLKRATAYVMGKSGAGLLAGAAIGVLSGLGVGGIEHVDTVGLSEAAIEAANEAAKNAAYLRHSIEAAIGVAGVAGISGYLVQGDFLHKRSQLVERYRDEIGALLDKAPDKVQEEDIAIAARGDFKKGIPANSSFRRELRNSWLNRNVGVILSATVSALTFLGVHALDMFVFDNSLGDLIHEKGGMFAAMGAEPAEFAKALGRNGLIGLVTYHTLKTPSHWLLADLLGIDEHTVNDRITDVKRSLGHGREVQPEQILGVFIHAHTEVREQFAAEYGKDYDQMSRSQQHELLAVVEQYMDIERLTHNINTGRMRPEELIFAVYDQKSGIEIAEEGRYQNNGNVLDGMWRGLQAVTGGYKTNQVAREHLEKVSDQIAAEMPGRTKVSVSTDGPDDASMHVHNSHEDEEGRKQSFVARVGRTAGAREDGNYVERLRQESVQEIVTPPVDETHQIVAKDAAHHTQRLRRQELKKGDLTPSMQTSA